MKKELLQKIMQVVKGEERRAEAQSSASSSSSSTKRLPQQKQRNHSSNKKHLAAHSSSSQKPNRGKKEFKPYPLNVPESSPLTDMEYKCHIMSLLKDDLSTLHRVDLLSSDQFPIMDQLRDLLHRISNRIFMKPNKNEMYLCGGLKTLCLLFNQLSTYMFKGAKNETNETMWKLYEEILSDFSFILYKMAEHTKARKVMLSTGILYSIWRVIQQLCAISADENILAEQTSEKENKKFYKLKMNYNSAVESSIVHMNDVMELLSSGLSLSADFAELLKSANRALFDEANEKDEFSNEEVDTFGLQSCDLFLGTSIDLPLEKWTQEAFDEFVRTNTNPQYFIHMNDFDIHLHGIILQARTQDFLEKFFVKWNFENQHSDDQKSNRALGFYILKKDQNISRFALLKFLQIVYTDSLLITSKDIEILRKEFDEQQIHTKHQTKDEDDPIRVFSVDNMLKEQGLLSLIDSLKNESTKEAILNSINMGHSNSNRSSERNQEEESLFDDFDEQLVKDEWELINKRNRSREEEEVLFSKRDKIRRHAIQTGGLEQDMTALFTSISEELYHKENEADVIIQTEGNALGAIDLEICNSDNDYTKKFVNQVLTPTQERGGIFTHRCILAARSEYLRKVFKYECMPKCLPIVEGMDVAELSTMDSVIDCSLKTIEIPNFSYSTLFLVLRFIYCGQNVLKSLASDLNNPHSANNDTQKRNVSEIQTKLSSHPLIPETFIECLIASDLFLLYGLKKFAEQQIVQQLNEKSQQCNKEFLVNLYNISQLYNSEALREKCERLLN